MVNCHIVSCFCKPTVHLAVYTAESSRLLQCPFICTMMVLPVIHLSHHLLSSRPTNYCLVVSTVSDLWLSYRPFSCLINHSIVSPTVHLSHHPFSSHPTNCSVVSPIIQLSHFMHQLFSCLTNHSVLSPHNHAVVAPCIKFSPYQLFSCLSPTIQFLPNHPFILFSSSIHRSLWLSTATKAVSHAT